jgi:hypothetical protein
MALPSSIVIGGAAWLAFLFFVLSGWGYLASRAARVADPDFGLRAAWGVAAYLAVAGAFLAVGLCSRPVILGLAGVGFAGFAWRELVTGVPSIARVHAAARFVRAQPAVGVLVIGIALLASYHLLGAVAQLDRNPWDDDIAYTPLVKRLLDAGNLVEPFSFRRLGAYGGQTVLQALGAARGNLASIHLVDRGLCQGLFLLLIVGHARERGKVIGLWLGLVVLIVLLLPDAAINTASYWSGAVIFLGLYRTVVRAHTVPDAGGFALAALVGAAACTLRQNYSVVVVVYLAMTLATARRDRRTWLLALAVGAIVLVQYAIAAYSATHTFLFPFWGGTWNSAIDLTPGVITWVDRLQYVITVCIDTAPILVLPAIALLLAFTRDERPGRPLTALFAASAIGLLVLALSFHGTDPSHLWRYAFGFAAALLVAFALEIGDTVDAPPVHLPALGRWMLLAALLLQLLVGRDQLAKRYAGIAADLREALTIDRHGDPSAIVERGHYAVLQSTIPAGARVAVMLDDPAFLDFARNEIFNLDTPGFASPAPGLPAFRGPDALAAYFRAQGIRYVAFVRTESSRYFYRRGFWVWRLFNDAEMFQTMSAYAIDMIDSLTALARTSTVLHDQSGLVALDLGASGQTAPTNTRSDEAARRDAWEARLADQEGLLSAWALTTRRDVRFEDGFSGLAFVDERVDDPKWYDASHATVEPKRGTPVKWMYRRSHVRLRANTPMHLSLAGKVNVATINARPRLDISLDGQLLGSVAVSPEGDFLFDITVPPRSGWRDLYLVWSTVAQPERDARDLRAARLERLTWEPR